MELTGPSLAARPVENADGTRVQLGGGDRGWGPGSNEGLGRRAACLSLRRPKALGGLKAEVAIELTWIWLRTVGDDARKL